MDPSAGYFHDVEVMPHLQWGLLLTLLFQWWQWLDWVQAFSLRLTSVGSLLGVIGASLWPGIEEAWLFLKRK